MAVEGYCFIAGMSSVLVCLPVLGICAHWRKKPGRTEKKIMS